MNRTLKAGVIGLGFMGRSHIAHLEKLPYVQVVAIADAEPARLENEATVSGNIKLPAPSLDFKSVQRFRDGRDLIAQADVDFVDICLPTDLHAELTILAAEAGRHILVEKPMALTSQEAQRMVDAAQRNGVELMVAQCVRFWPEYQYLKETVTSGRLGKLLKAEFTRRSSAPVWAWQRWMMDARRSGGAALDLHIHDVDFVNHLLGTPVQLYATGARTPVTGGYDVITSMYTYADGASVTIDGGWYAAPSFGFGATYLAVFEGGIVRYNGTAQPTLMVYRNEGGAPEVPDVAGDAYYNEIEFFTKCLAEGRSPATFLPASSSLQSLRLVEAEIRSIEAGAPVKMA
jgi:predicted dehydrogenase